MALAKPDSLKMLFGFHFSLQLLLDQVYAGIQERRGGTCQRG
jgi:hypothetical protein